MASPQNDLQQGLTFHQAGNLAAAQACYQRVLSAQPRNSDALHLFGALLAGQGEADRGIELMRKAVTVQPRFPAAHFNLGNALHGRGRLAEAEAAFGTAAGQKPDFAEAHCNQGNLLVLLDRPKEAEAAFRKAVACRPAYEEVHHNLGILLRRQGRMAEAVQALARAVALAPGNARTWVDLGSAFEDGGKPADAEEAYRRAIAADPRNASARCCLGTLLRKRGRTDEAVAAFRAALEADPDNLDALNNLGATLSEARRFAEALPALDRAVRLAPGAAEARNNRGMALQGLGRLEEAADAFGEAVKLRPAYADAWANLGNARVAANRLAPAFEAYERSLAIDPTNAMTRKNAAMARLLDGNFSRGWREYEARWEAYPAEVRRNFGVPQWTGDAPLAGRSVLLHAEQGMGDTLQFIRYVPRVVALGAAVTLEVQGALRALLAAQDLGVRVIARGDPLPPFDLHCPLLSLPRAFGTEAASIPAPLGYLRPDPVKVAAWQKRLEGREGFKVGFVWAGNPLHANDHNRSIPLAGFRRILGTARCGFISLQRDAAEADRAVLAGLDGVTDWTREFADFSDTAALVAALDGVVAVDTSVAHLAAALGKRTWILLPFSPDWRWLLGREDSPWYPTARLCRQPETGAWDPVLSQVVENLTAVAMAAEPRDTLG